MHRDALPNYAALINSPSTEPVREDVVDGPVALARALIRGANRYKYWLGFWIAACTLLAVLYANSIAPTFRATATILLEPRRPPSTSPDNTTQPTLDVYRAESEFQVIRSERLLAYVFNQLQLQLDYGSDANAGQPPDPASRPDGSPSLLDRLGVVDSPGSDSSFSTLLGSIRRGFDTHLGEQDALSALASSPEIVRQRAFAQFIRNVDVNRVGQSYVVEVSFSSPDAVNASRVANAIASAYLWQSLALKADAAINGAEFLQGRVDALTHQRDAAAAAVAAGTLPASLTPDADARVIGAALQPLEPSAPRKKLIIALGGVLGLLSGVFAIAVVQTMNQRIYTPEEASRISGLPCLAVIPPKGRRVARRSKADRAAFLTALRELRTSLSIALQSGRRDEGHHVMAITAWKRGSGCTLIAQHLAQMIHGSGTKVTLIDADLRIGLQASDDAAAESAGEGTSTLADILMERTRPEEISYAEFKGVDMLPGPSRNMATNYIIDLGAARMSHLLDHVRVRGDVVVDLPPLSSAADSKAVARQADAVVVVLVAGETTADDLILAVRSLKEVGANVIGVVLNTVK